MNGYDNLEIFAEIDHEDLNALNILDSESRTKLITAAELLTDYSGGYIQGGHIRYTEYRSVSSCTIFRSPLL